MCVGSFLPFQTTYYLNGHHFIAGELERQGVRFRRDDNAFLWTANPEALQVAADRLTAEVIRKRLDYWTRVLGPKFSAQDRAAGTAAARVLLESGGVLPQFRLSAPFSDPPDFRALV